MAGSSCIDGGDESAADSAYGDDIWQTLTTRKNDELDATPVDNGYHYAPGAIQIETFSVDDTNATWTAEGPAGTQCSLFILDDGRSVSVDIAGGTALHGGASTQEIVMVSALDSDVAVASALVP